MLHYRRRGGISSLTTAAVFCSSSAWCRARACFSNSDGRIRHVFVDVVAGKVEAKGHIRAVQYGRRYGVGPFFSFFETGEVASHAFVDGDGGRAGRGTCMAARPLQIRGNSTLGDFRRGRGVLVPSVERLDLTHGPGLREDAAVLHVPSSPFRCVQVFGPAWPANHGTVDMFAPRNASAGLLVKTPCSIRERQANRRVLHNHEVVSTAQREFCTATLSCLHLPFTLESKQTKT